MSIKQIRSFVELSVNGDKTLGERVQLLKEHKKAVEAQIEEMHRYLEKVTCKIERFSRQHKAYEAKRTSNP
jgi:DNA-binding transcriptional MerR regulator